MAPAEQRKSQRQAWNQRKDKDAGVEERARALGAYPEERRDTREKSECEETGAPSAAAALGW
jgi:hypothetical protein